MIEQHGPEGGRVTDWNVLQVYDGTGRHGTTDGSAVRVMDQLNDLDIPNRLVTVNAERRSGRSRDRIAELVPRWPGYVFARVSDGFAMREVKGIKGWMMAGDCYLSVSDARVQDWMRRYDERDLGRIETLFTAGDDVTVTFGSLRGYTLAVSEVDRERGMLKLETLLLGGIIAAVDMRHVEKA